MTKHPYKRMRKDGGFIDKHRLIMEEHLGRKLKPNELVHHKDGDPTNDIIKNLELTTRRTHTREHALNGDYHKFTKEDRVKGAKINSANKRAKRQNGDSYLCHKCNTMKHKSEYGKNKTCWNGLQHWCKECMSIYHKRRYASVAESG